MNKVHPIYLCKQSLNSYFCRDEQLRGRCCWCCDRRPTCKELNYRYIRKDYGRRGKAAGAQFEQDAINAAWDSCVVWVWARVNGLEFDHPAMTQRAKEEGACPHLYSTPGVDDEGDKKSMDM